MRKSFKRIELIGIAFVWITGTLLHFTYEWSGNSAAAALVAPINESPWEHLKMLFFPFILYALFEYFILGKKFKNFTSAKLLGIVSGMAFILVAFYTYYGIYGQEIIWFDIIIFLTAAYLAYSISCFHCLHRAKRILPLKLAPAMLIFTAACFAVFTLFPPALPLFAGI